MAFFERKIKPETDLRGIPTDRLLREFLKTKDAIATVNQANAAGEFATPENPVQLDGRALFDSINGMIVHAYIAEELERRGIKPSE